MFVYAAPIQCSPLDFCVLMHHLMSVRKQTETTSDMVLSDFNSQLMHSICKEVIHTIEYDCRIAGKI